jgi:predicted transglutaminase-like cysteine proteinase
MIPKLFSDKFMKRREELRISVADMLGLKKSKIVFYPFITSKGFQDIRNVFKQTKEEDEELIDYYSKYIDSDMTLFDKARIIAMKVNRRIEYVSDIINFKQAEYWAKPIEIHQNRLDDCDGYAVLMCYLLRLFGAKEHEVFIRAGYVKGKLGNKFGHANIIIFDENTFLFYPLEGSFYPKESLKNFGKIPLILNPLYLRTWWITNDIYSYSTIPFLRFVR